MLETKQDHLQDAMKKLDFVRNSHKSVTRELAELKIQKERLEVDFLWKRNNEDFRLKIHT